MEPADPELTAFAVSAAPYTGFLGAEIVAASPEEVRSRLAWSEEKCTTGVARVTQTQAVL